MTEPRESSGSKRARLRGIFTPSKASGYNRKQRKAIAIQATREAKNELLDAGCNLLEARKEAVNPHRKSVTRQIKQVWKNRAELHALEKKQKQRKEQSNEVL
jgi:hypothetical protein